MAARRAGAMQLVVVLGGSDESELAGGELAGEGERMVRAAPRRLPRGASGRATGEGIRAASRGWTR
jgi:hypothetical protein